jgi:hypothetical protein
MRFWACPMQDRHVLRPFTIALVIAAVVAGVYFWRRKPSTTRSPGGPGLNVVTINPLPSGP